MARPPDSAVKQIRIFSSLGAKGFVVQGYESPALRQAVAAVEHAAVFPRHVPGPMVAGKALQPILGEYTGAGGDGGGTERCRKRISACHTPPLGGRSYRTRHEAP